MRIVIVDDHREVIESLRGFLESLGHTVDGLTDPQAAVRRVAAQPVDVVLSDLRMPGLSGLELLDALEALDVPPAVVLMTAFGDGATAMEALRRGAVDYLAKPIDVRDLHHLLERIEGQQAPSEDDPAICAEQADGVIVAGPTFANVVRLADRLHRAPHLPCLIEAETGCGKELIARRIHHGGDATTTKPFIALNAAAIAPGLFEAELFGYAAGSFTGARSGGQEGKFALAGDGTLFLDEVGELPLDQQAKLLRVLEERRWYPVGGNQQRHFKARLVCASNLKLSALVASGRFREDLLYRLKVGHVLIPPLRERRDEIVPLARALLAHAARRLSCPVAHLEPTAEQLLAGAPWPGNVRQLTHVLEVALLMAEGRPLRAEHLLPHVEGVAPVGRLRVPAGPPPVLDLPDDGLPLDAWHQALIAAALERCGHSPVRTAAYLGITRKVLYTLRKRYGLLR